MLRDVGEPQRVDVIGGEVALDQVIVDRWSRTLAVLAALLPQHGQPLVVWADPPRGPLAHLFTGLAGFAEEEPVAELGVIAVGIQ